MALLIVFLAATLFLPVVLIFLPLLAALLGLFAGSSTHAQVNRNRMPSNDGNDHADAQTAMRNYSDAHNSERTLMFKRNGNDSSINGRAVAPATARPAAVIPTVAILVEALGSPSALVRRRAACQLGRLGTLALDAIPALQTAVADKNGKVRRAARQALRQIQRQQAQDKTPFWRRFLNSLRQAFSVPHA